MIPTPDAGTLEDIAPVDTIRPPGAEPTPQAGIALCLSGGGYRAMLFHVGALWRLHQAGYLSRLERISSVSGGSIAAAWLGLQWNLVSQQGVDDAFETRVVTPIRRLASRTIDLPAIVLGVLFPRGANAWLRRAYRRRLYGTATLQSLPDRPRFVFTASNVQSGALWRFMKPYMRDYRVGEVRHPITSMATVVAASSAFPPFLSPASLRLKTSDYTAGSGLDLQVPPFTTRVTLTDGGVYDNLALETAWKRYRTVLVSDGGNAPAPQPAPWRNWLGNSYRVLRLIDNQVQSLRLRQLIASYRLKIRGGAYWGIRTPIADYGLADALPCPPEMTAQLASVPTRLRSLPSSLQERLINWGFAACDAALRTYVDRTLVKPARFPYPRGVG